MKKFLKILIIPCVIFAVSLLLLMPVKKLLGNASFLPKHGNCATAAATTSVSILAGSAATSTLTCDIYNLDSNVVNGNAADSAILAIQFNASSTNSMLAINVEYSNDNIEWYQNNLEALASTSPVATINTVQTYYWQFASSTPGLGTTALQAVVPTSGRDNKLITIKTPTRYVRAIFTLKPGSTGGSVWAEFIPKKQVP